jgi:hypothetical protein
MVVPVFNGDHNGYGDSSIGLVSCSSMRGLFHSAPGEGQGTFWGTRLASTFSIWEPKACMGYAYNGHTALIARVDGRVSAVVGWNPWSYGIAQLKTTWSNWSWFGEKNKFTCSGTWYDDTAMIYDPTSISLEMGVLPIDAMAFADQISTLVGGTGLGGANFEYTFLPAEMESNDHPFVGQCTELAVVVLCSWLYRLNTGRELINQLLAMANSQDMNERNLLQGKMMQFISNWNKTHK